MSFPAPLSVRSARPEDYRDFVRLFPELAVDDVVADRARFERELMVTTLIAETGGASEPPQAVGYAYFQLIAGTAYVRHIVTAPEARNRGVGRALLAEIARRALGAGCTSWCLNVKPDNKPAIALYERMGLTRAFESRALRMSWSHVDGRQTLHDATVSARVIEPADDARVEPPMKLLPGQLAASRSMAGRVLVGLFDADVVLGATVFDPNFPGAYPFRVARPDLALVLLGALRPYARPSDELVNVVIEGQPDVADTLIAAGATVKVDIVHMSSSTIATAVPAAGER
jgi:ribosomal protein S18 acetylase RimI-like enzyme